MTLRLSFLEPYRQRGDAFNSLLARSTYKNKYCRDGESWTDTIARVVNGNTAADPNITEEEEEALFDAFWNMHAMPPGRGLWTGGVPGIPVDARYNCHGLTVRSTEDWCWCMNMLMLGGGVGLGLQKIDQLPVVTERIYRHVPSGVSQCDLADIAFDGKDAAQLGIYCSETHPDVAEVAARHLHQLGMGAMRYAQYVVPDTREGWVQAFRLVLEHAFAGKDLSLNLSHVRRRGSPIKTFGGTACGPGPLAQLLTGVWDIIRSYAGRKLDTLGALDVTTMIGRCVSAGNVRRSALLVLAPHSEEFLKAKEDNAKLMSNRYTSNNTIVVEKLSDYETIDWLEVVKNNIKFGDPGLFNQELIQRADPEAVIINPCGEILLHDYEACNLAEVFPARCIRDGVQVEDVLALTTRYSLRQRVVPMEDEKANAVREKNMRIGVGLGGLCDFDWTPDLLKSWYKVVRQEADRYAGDLGVNRPIAVTTVKPSGTISLLADSSPGLHAPFAPYYLRRVRIDKDDQMVQALMEAGVPCEPCVYNQNSVVFAFPTKAKHDKFFAQTESVKDQLERNLQLQQHWSDNSVSVTVSFHADKPEELAELLPYYGSRLRTCSFMSRTHGYQQPPYEEISKELYEDLYGRINHNHPLVHGKDIEIDECSSGACPIR